MPRRQRAILKLLKDKPMKLQEIWKSQSVTYMWIIMNIMELMKKNWIRKKIDKKDTRLSVYVITKEGRKVIEDD